MISWIKGDVITLWQTNNKFFILINCQNIGYEIQILESTYIKLKTSQVSNNSLILWLKQIKKEDTDLLFGFLCKDQKDFFKEVLNIKGIGAQIGMTMLNKYSINEIIDAIKANDKKLIGSIQGIGQKMTERIILELKNNYSDNNTEQDEVHNLDNFKNNIEIAPFFEDLNLTLRSLNYPNKEIKKVIPHLIKEIKNNKTPFLRNDQLSFEILLKEAMNYLNNNNSNLGQ